MPSSSLIAAERKAWDAYSADLAVVSVDSKREFVGKGFFTILTRHRPRMQTKIGDYYIYKALSYIEQSNDMQIFDANPPKYVQALVHVQILRELLARARLLRDSLTGPLSLVAAFLTAERYRRTAHAARFLVLQDKFAETLQVGKKAGEGHVAHDETRRSRARAELTGDRGPNGVIVVDPFPIEPVPRKAQDEPRHQPFGKPGRQRANRVYKAQSSTADAARVRS
ncbi:hypothetical protein FA95DRAFT_1560483 [Auriscalpium vulgare]|uniref:Uncharacterized protein n=1 Tax=Auriscalpium vulgare TaxID=40419 RepID=A0ACB8RPW9_9AGAM|nr:hypothetical protein FA95DRAFT_1560483 [Auriscalpium vulgare]